MKDDPTNNYGHDPTQDKVPTKARMLVDYERYAKMLDHPDLTDEQKRDFIDCLWNLITEVIYLGIEVLPQDDPFEDRFVNMLEHIQPTVLDSGPDQSNKTVNKHPAP